MIRLQGTEQEDCCLWLPQPRALPLSGLRGWDIPGSVGQADKQQGREAGIEFQLPQGGQVHMQGASPKLLLQVSGQSADGIPVDSRKHQRGRRQVQGILGARERQKDELARDQWAWASPQTSLAALSDKAHPHPHLGLIRGQKENTPHSWPLTSQAFLSQKPASLAPKGTVLGEEMQDSPLGPWLREDSYLQVRKGAILLVSKHTTICCEVLNAQLVGKQRRCLRSWARAGAFAETAKSHLQSGMVWSKE